jgi:hypothetical protein
MAGDAGKAKIIAKAKADLVDVPVAAAHGPGPRAALGATAAPASRR